MSISFKPEDVFAIVTATAALDVCTGEALSKAFEVSRALGRFQRELDAYRGGMRNLAVVRKYHRLLVDTLAPFKGDTVHW